MEKETSNFWSIMIDQLGLGQMTAKQKIISTWFCLSFVFVGISGESLLLASIAVVNFGIASYVMVKQVPMKDE